MNRTSLLATGLGLLFCALTAPARAEQIINGYGAFKPYPNGGSQQCVGEYWGGALNQCGSTQTYMIFELPIPDTGRVYENWRITAVGYTSDGSGAWWDCQAVAIAPEATDAKWGAGQSFSYTGTFTNWFDVKNVPNGWSLRLQCNGVPPNKGIQHLRWTNY